VQNTKYLLVAVVSEIFMRPHRWRDDGVWSLACRTRSWQLEACISACESPVVVAVVVCCCVVVA